MKFHFITINCVKNDHDSRLVLLCNLFHPSDLCDAGTSESHNDSYNIDSKLELKKLGDAVVDISAPHNCFHDAAEVVVGENDI